MVMLLSICWFVFSELLIRHFYFAGFLLKCKQNRTDLEAFFKGTIQGHTKNSWKHTDEKNTLLLFCHLTCLNQHVLWLGLLGQLTFSFCSDSEIFTIAVCIHLRTDDVFSTRSLFFIWGYGILWDVYRSLAVHSHSFQDFFPQFCSR